MSDDQPQGGTARSLRRSAARFILATPPLRKAFLRIALDEGVLTAILEDPLFVYRVLHEKPVTGRLANVLDNPLVFQHYLSSNRVQDRLLDDETFHGRLAEEESLLLALAMRGNIVPMLAEHPEALAQLAAAPNVARALAGYPAFVSALAREAGVAEALAADSGAVTALASSEALGRSLAAQPSLNKHLAGDTDFLRALITAEGVVPTLASMPELRTYLARLPSRAAELAQDADFVGRLLQHDGALAVLLANEDIVAQLLASDRLVRRIAADPIALNTILSQPRSRDAILTDPRIVGAILHDERAIAQILHDPAVLQRIAPRGETINAILNNAQAARTLFEDQRSIEMILGNEHLLKRLTPRGKALAVFLNDPDYVNHLAETPAVVERVLQRKSDAKVAKKLKALIDFDTAWAQLMPFAEPGTDLAQRAAAARAKLNDASEVPPAMLDLLCEGDRIHLPGATLEVPDRRSLWVVLHEILVEEEYYFETRTAAPRILDCGTHFGLALYYFKRQYPEARITAFEPLPRLNAMAQRNIDANGMRGVELLPYALHNADGDTTFYISEADSMAGSLTERRRSVGDHLVPVPVPCRKLSAWLDEPVHFLKLDIEGSEDVVLEEAADKLKNVQHIFCEYHHGAGLDPQRLPKILNILESAGFDTHMGKSYSYHQAMHLRPMKHVGRSYSLAIWAKNRNWS